ncbi:very-long-chain 3-oxoacyl-CoA reductase-like [Polistes fuscatus]|uniref:very-long-chain 3-oxoacyl-CoA reductase-like n=1 Tax=Polistes fuscatus TaxID=30207 RepID=UPI001CA8516A|nr:very-long-chain 3-oxoacyl-CoA reductase-like [Polistes fuscatus]
MIIWRNNQIKKNKRMSGKREMISLVILTVVSLRILLKISYFTWIKLLAPNLGLGIDLKSQGRWAVITGGTDGIGKAYAKALAAKGLDIVLVSRSLIKLRNVETEIKEKYGVETRIIEADLTKVQEVYSKIATVIEELEVGILINNAAMSYDYPELMTEVPEELLNQILQINVAGLTGVTRVVLPGMIKRKKGVVINISSVMGDLISPYLTVYAASKAYVIKFSADLAAELSSSGITVQCIIPGPVATKMLKTKSTNWMIPTADDFSQSSLKTVGIESLTTGYFSHHLFYAFGKTVAWVYEKGAIQITRQAMFKLKNNYLKYKMMKQQKMEMIAKNDALI